MILLLKSEGAMSGTPLVEGTVADQLGSQLGRFSPMKEKKKQGVKWNNVLVGAGIQLFEVCTLGQPFEVLKTHMAGMFISKYSNKYHSFIYSTI